MAYIQQLHCREAPLLAGQMFAKKAPPSVHDVNATTGSPQHKMCIETCGKIPSYGAETKTPRPPKVCSYIADSGICRTAKEANKENSRVVVFV